MRGARLLMLVGLSGLLLLATIWTAFAQGGMPGMPGAGPPAAPAPPPPNAQGQNTDAQIIDLYKDAYASAQQGRHRQVLSLWQRIVQLASETPPATAEGWHAVGSAYMHLMASAFDRAIQAGGLPPDQMNVATQMRDSVWGAQGQAQPTPQPVQQPPPAPTQPAQPAQPQQTGRVAAITQPSAIPQFAADPSYATLWIKCERKSFTTRQIEALDQWVRAGHRVMVSNDVAAMFDFEMGGTYSGYSDWGAFDICAKPDSHPLIMDVGTLDMSSAVCTIKHPKAKPLICSRDHPTYIWLAVCKYGAGEVVFCGARGSWGGIRVAGDTDGGPIEDGYDKSVFMRNLAAYMKTFPGQ